MRNWFPLNAEMLEHLKFKTLSPTQKLYFLFILSELNKPRSKGKPYYRSDLAIAATLGVQEITIRVARRKLHALGWLDYRPGTRAKGKHLATVYLSCRWSHPPRRDSHVFYAQMHRHAFDMMLARCRDGTFSVEDVLVYVVLCYFHWRNRGKREDHNFFVSRWELSEILNFGGIERHIESLYRNFVFGGGSHLFTAINEDHRWTFTGWAGFADPSEQKNNAEVAVKVMAKLEADIERRKCTKAAKTQATGPQRIKRRKAFAVT